MNMEELNRIEEDKGYSIWYGDSRMTDFLNPLELQDEIDNIIDSFESNVEYFILYHADEYFKKNEIPNEEIHIFDYYKDEKSRKITEVKVILDILPDDYQYIAECIDDYFGGEGWLSVKVSPPDSELHYHNRLKIKKMKDV